MSENSAVIVQQGASSSVLWVAEGVETALSVAKAIPNQTVVASLSAGKLQSVPVSNDTQTVVICADNDPPSSNTKIKVVEAVERFLSIGKRVFIAMPPEIPTGMKDYDFNDLLLEKGIDAVKGVVNNRVEIRDAGLLKLEESLASSVEKTRGSERGNIAQTLSPVSLNVKVQRELGRE